MIGFQCKLVAVIALALLVSPPAAAQSPRNAETVAEGVGCDANVGASCTALGVRYMLGDGLPLNNRLALGLTLKGCTLADGEGCMHHGYMLERSATAADPLGFTQALSFFNKACSLGNALGCNNAGQLYVDGTGTPVDRNKAEVLFDQACTMKSSIGCSNLGIILTNFDAPQQGQVRRAFAAFTSGCNYGYMAACHNLAWSHRRGVGTFRNPERALALYQQACDKGFGPSCAHLAQQRPITPRLRVAP